VALCHSHGGARAAGARSGHGQVDDLGHRATTGRLLRCSPQPERHPSRTGLRCMSFAGWVPLATRQAFDDSAFQTPLENLVRSSSRLLLPKLRRRNADPITSCVPGSQPARYIAPARSSEQTRANQPLCLHGSLPLMPELAPPACAAGWNSYWGVTRAVSRLGEAPTTAARAPPATRLRSWTAHLEATDDRPCEGCPRRRHPRCDFGFGTTHAAR